MFSNLFIYLFIYFENRTVYEIMWKNVLERGRPQSTLWRKRTACWIPKAINTHSEYVILIASPLPQWLHEPASVLRYTYSTFPVFFTLEGIPENENIFFCLIHFIRKF